MTFRDKLRAAAARNDSLLCVGLDPQPARMPVEDVLTFCRTIIEATSDLVCVYKPQAAFFEALGLEGWKALKATIEAVPDDIPVILDAKRGDIATTAEAYATACFDVMGADAVTVNPYLGGDGVLPFLSRPDRTAFVLCRTSNPSAPDLQDLEVPVADGGTEPTYMRVAGLANEWNREHQNVGLVVGATYPEELSAIRRRCPDLPILLPGIGAQGGDLEASVAVGLDGVGGGLMLSASRAVLYASAGGDYAEAARAAADELRLAINVARAQRPAPSIG
jgi:orotidine-5'-phosphate decarboxylase